MACSGKLSPIDICNQVVIEADVLVYEAVASIDCFNENRSIMSL
jgi:hypothetical protein